MTRSVIAAESASAGAVPERRWARGCGAGGGGEGGDLGGRGEKRPGLGHCLLVRAGPLQDGECCAAVEDGADHVRVGKGIGKAIGLEAVFAFVDRVGDVHGEDERGFAGGGEGREEGEGESKSHTRSVWAGGQIVIVALAERGEGGAAPGLCPPPGIFEDKE